MRTKPTKRIILEQANGESFTKRVNGILRYHAKLQGISPEETAKSVRESVIRALDNCAVAVFNADGKFEAIG